MDLSANRIAHYGICFEQISNPIVKLRALKSVRYAIYCSLLFHISQRIRQCDINFYCIAEIFHVTRCKMYHANK